MVVQFLVILIVLKLDPDIMCCFVTIDKIRLPEVTNKHIHVDRSLTVSCLETLYTLMPVTVLESDAKGNRCRSSCSISVVTEVWNRCLISVRWALNLSLKVFPICPAYWRSHLLQLSIYIYIYITFFVLQWNHPCIEVFSFIVQMVMFSVGFRYWQVIHMYKGSCTGLSL